MASVLGTLLLLAVVGWLLFGRQSGRRAELEQILADAERDGVITPEQRETLLARADARSPTGRPSATAWLAILAALFVVAGVAMLIASNWEDIGATVRVVAYVTILALVGEGSLRSEAPIRRTALELVWLVFPLLGIALYSQTFQLSGDEVAPFLTWLALTTPLAWLSSSALVATIHTAALASVALWGSFAPADTVMSLRGAPDPLHWLLAVGVVAALVVQGHRLLPEGQRLQTLGVVATWIFGVLTTAEPFAIRHEGWLLLAAAALTTGWVAATFHRQGDLAEVGAAFLSWLGVLYAMSFTWHDSAVIDGVRTTWGMAAIGALTVSAVAASATLPRIQSLTTSAETQRRLRWMLLGPCALGLLLSAGNPDLTDVAAVLANIGLFGVAVGLMWTGSEDGSVARINLGIGVLLVVLVTRFIDVLGSLVESGVGLIAAGVLLASLAWGLEKTRKRLIDAAARNEEGADG